MHNSDMTIFPRLYENILAQHLAENRQMAFVSGPRQVGKTTVCGRLADKGLNYDVPQDRLKILEGQAGLEHWLPSLGKGRRPVLLLDELHKHPKWKNYLKGLFDGLDGRWGILVTGSSRMDAFRRAGDALTGRYFSYRMHPLSVAELADPSVPKQIRRPPQRVKEADYQALEAFGGFPEPFLRREAAYAEKWRQRRYESLLREDVRDLSRVSMLGSLETLAHLLAESSAQQLTLSTLATTLAVSPHTVKAWLEVLVNLHYGFLLRPYLGSINRSLRKEPKWYIRDWSGIEDPGQRFETMVACHLLKAVDAWTDLGLGRFSLHYVRNKEGQEVDFLVCLKGKPWALVEAKLSDTQLSRPLIEYQKSLQAAHAFQVVGGLEYRAHDPFEQRGPLVVPARTFLSQLA
jgi:uncharacterized protein